MTNVLKVVLSFAIIVTARHAAGQWYPFSDFVGDSQTVIHATTSNPSVGGAGEMVWVTQDCGGRTMLFWMKGLNSNGPWGSEVHYLEDSFWKSLHDNEYNEFGYPSGQLNKHLVFRDDASHRKGFTRIHESVSAQGAAAGVAPYHEEHWNLACDATYHLGMPPAGTVTMVLDMVLLNAMTVLDCRGANNACSPTPVPVDVWEHTDYWGSNIEVYRFGRWINPSTNQAEGLGLVEWTRSGPDIGGCPHYSPCTTTNGYVVQGYPYVPCVTCPDN